MLITDKTITFNQQVIAHRGASFYAPENTIAAFAKAKELGAEWVEFDVMFCKDELVVFHDFTLDRTTNAFGNINDIPYTRLKSFDAGSWFSKTYAKECIPTLVEVIKFLTKNNLRANIEIKSRPQDDERIALAVLKTLADHWPIDYPPPLLSSFSIRVLEVLRANSQDVLLGLLMHNLLPDWQEIITKLSTNAVAINDAIVNKQLIEQAKNLSQKVLVYTIYNRNRAQQLLALGVDAIFADDVKLLK